MSDAKETEAPAPALGIWMCTALVVGNVVGSGIFLLPATLGAYGSISIVGWICTALGSMALALVFARLAALVPKAGGPYTYTREGFGDFAGFWIAWGYWIAVWAGNAAVAVAAVSYLTVFAPVLKHQNWLAGAVALAVVWIMTWVNCRGVKNAGTMQLITAILKMAPLIAIATFGLLWVEPDHFTPLNRSDQSAFSALSATAALTLWSFLGLESATVPAGDVVEPERTIPRATILGTLIAAVVYILAMIAVLGVLPPDQLAGSNAPFSDAAARMWGNWAAYLVGLGAIVSCLGTVNGFTLLQGQVPMAAARDGLFPARFGQLSKAGVPAFALVVSSALITLLLVMNYSGTGGLVAIFEFIILLATLTTLVPYAFCAMAELLILIRRPEQFRPKRLFGSGAIAAVAFVYAVWTVFGSGPEIVLYGFLLMLAGIPVYVWIVREQARPRPATADAPLSGPSAEQAIMKS